jgi:cation transport regulator ChaC
MNSLRSRERAQTNGAVEVFSKLEGEIREVYFRSATAPRVPQQNDNELTASNIGSLLQRVSGTSVQEIEKLIAELQILRDMLQKEAARVQREIVGYAALIQNARRSISTISESFSFWQSDRDDPPRISA